MNEEMKPQQWQTDVEAERVVEAALRSLPMQEPPAALFQRVMSQVNRPVQATRPADLPVFRVRWVDFVVSLFFAVMLGLVMMVGGWLPPVVRMTLDWQWQWFQALHFDWLLAGGLAMGALACGLAAVLFSASQPHWVRRP